ncbi:efflux RND transporter periplasmic adaptor subunit [Limisphaera ngatamarikiensis]|uniref:Efflux RND transporter periplasmic adaptor subunit n=1 Tax=Limisphaera ngatamarikiensis TaxID=1324935 RepID=A0A6M1RSU4_9BACT|nr:efflux RND transporter periplasmic adaptor subunit [Limisphaera ngatamarikiensis]NGO40447.1 efflux RND transporter periplasmic adaptor subunit [Limisphaera ngatamarikiensis]
MKFRAIPFLCLFLGVLTGCHRPHSGPAESAPSLPAATVKVQPVERLRRWATEEVVGTVRPKLRAALEAKVQARIEEMLVVPGQSVRAGELLVRLDDREIRARYEQARAVYEQAERDFRRREKLFQEQTISRAEYDAAEAQLRVAAAALQEAETQLGHTRIVAPFDGVITAKHADVGDLAVPGRALLEIEDPKALRLEADLPEALLDRVQLGQTLTVRVPAAQVTLEGTVSEITPVADPRTRTFPVKVDLPARPGLRSGQFGRLLVPVAEVEAIRVPVRAIHVKGQMELAYVVKEGRAELRLVKTGKRLGEEVEVVSGLAAGESLVVESDRPLRDGQPVTIR